MVFPLQIKRFKKVAAVVCLGIFVLLTANPLHSAGARIQLNYHNVSIEALIETISKFTGRAFLFQKRSLRNRTITLLSSERFTQTEALEILEASLRINGYSMVKAGKAFKILPLKQARREATPLYKEESETQSNSMVTRIIQVQNAPARRLLSNLKRLTSRNTVLIVVQAANAFIVKDTRENTERIAQLIRLLDRDETEIAKSRIELVELKHADAAKMQKTVSTIFRKPRSKKAKNQPQSTLTVLHDRRTNRLILIGGNETLEKILMLVKQLDQDIDHEKELIKVVHLKHAQAKAIADSLAKLTKSLLKGKKKAGKTKINVIPHIPSNSLVLSANKTQLMALEQVIETLDVKRSLVYLQAVIMEVSVNKSSELGIEWQASQIAEGNGNEFLVTAGGVGATGTPKTLAATASSTGSSGSVIGILGDTITYGDNNYSSLNAFVKASQNDTEINILSNPQLLTLNNEEAEIKVGTIVPTIGATKTDSNGNTTTQIDYKEVGISIKVTPRVNHQNKVVLTIDQNSSNIVSGQIDALSKQGAVTTLNRSVSSKIAVDSGQTVVLGGLLNDDRSQQVIKTPCLGDIPVLGWLFKRQSSSLRKTNLIVFLRPEVIRSTDEMDRIREQMNRQYEGKDNSFDDIELNSPLSEESEDGPG